MNSYTDETWALVDDALAHLEQAWKSAPNPPFADLPATGSEARQPILVQLIKADQECRWRTGDRKGVEDYLTEWPELGRQPEILKELAQAEYCTRVACDAAPTRQELQSRFPEVAGQLDLDAIAAEAKNRRAPPARLPKGHRLGAYEIIDLLGNGAMGAVYLAEDAQLHRRVAVKVPSRGQFSSPDDVERFLREAETIAALQHPGIVAVHHLDRDGDGMPLIVMQHVEGDSLDKLLAGGRLPPEQAAAVMADVAAAVHYAHQRGFVHRDLKPANLLLDKAGRPHVADFGLALHESVQRRQAGEYAGSLPYMAPEQVRGESHRLDGRADVWAIGVMLYEMLTGRRPFEGDSEQQLQDEILQRPPKPPRQTGCGDEIPPALERICLKCLAKDVADRYTTAGDLARDLKQYLQPSRRLGLVLSAAATLAAAVLLLAAVLFFHSGGPITPLPVPRASLDVLVWNPAEPSRHELSIGQPGTAPLRRGDQVRVEARLSRPMYLYLVWIDSQGRASPLFPWPPGRWSERPKKETPFDRVSLPEPINQGWPVEGPAGMETLVLLARNDPLPPDVHLAQLLADLPKQPARDPHAVLWFAEGRSIGKGGVSRGLALSDPKPIDDPQLKMQQLLWKRLGRYFPVQRAVSMAADTEKR
jgi:hypothetical protein